MSDAPVDGGTWHRHGGVRPPASAPSHVVAAPKLQGSRAKVAKLLRPVRADLPYARSGVASFDAAAGQAELAALQARRS